MRIAKQVYNAEAELERGANLTAVSYDPRQTALVTGGRATVGGKPVTAEISGVAAGGTVNLWLSRFDFKKPDGTIQKVPDLNVPAPLAPRQGAIDTARKIASYINRSRAPYKAKASGSRDNATLSIVFALRS